MKLKQLDNYIDFMETVRRCRADVYFCSEEGDRLSLKSMLSQLLFATVCGDKDFLSRGYVECTAEEDYALLAPYLVP